MKQEQDTGLTEVTRPTQQIANTYNASVQQFFHAGSNATVVNEMSQEKKRRWSWWRFLTVIGFLLTLLVSLLEVIAPNHNFFCETFGLFCFQKQGATIEIESTAVGGTTNSVVDAYEWPRGTDSVTFDPQAFQSDPESEAQQAEEVARQELEMIAEEHAKALEGAADVNLNQSSSGTTTAPNW